MRKWLPAIVMAYMLTALLWWAILLLNRAEKIYELQLANSNTSVEFAAREYQKQKNMIFGEGLVFGLSLLMGIYFIYRAYKKELDVTKDQNNFLLSISHELKSPLTSINLALETLKKRALQKEAADELCDMALDESKRLEYLIGAILLAAKLDYGYSLSKENFDINELIRNVIKVYQTTHAHLSISFKTNNTEAIVYADRAALWSVIINLLDNAIKYGSQKPISISSNTDDLGVVIDIADEGIGIPHSEIPKIFNKFYRVGNESIRKYKGTGLGLYIVKKILVAHGSKIAVKDNQPSGCIFTFKIGK